MQLDIPQWEVILYDLNDNPVMDITRFVTFTLNMKLNDVSTFEFEVDLTQFEKVCTDIGLTPRNVIYPAKTEVRVSLDGVDLFGGVISSANSSLGENGQKLSVRADSYLQYFAKRLLNKNYTSTDRSQIAWDAIDTVQSITYGDLGVTQGTLATTYSSDLTADYRDVKSIIMLYTYASPTTYDFEITPSKVFNTYTRLGSDKPLVKLSYPRNVTSIEISRESDSLYNKVTGLGSGIGDERIQTTKEDINSKARYRIQEAKKLYNSVVLQATLEENTQGFLDISTEPLVIPSLKTTALGLNLAEVFVGDSITVQVENTGYNDDVNLLLRIYELSVSVDENFNQDISVKFYNPNTGGGVEEDA